MSDIKISCPHCEQHIALDAGWAGKTLDCPACGKQFQVPGQAPAEPSAAPSPAPQPPLPQAPGLRINRPEAPSAPPPLSPQPSASTRRPMPRPAMAGGAAPRTSGLAITSLILSILGCFGISAIAAVICGHLARRSIRNNRSLTGGGMALAGLIIGYLFIALWVGWVALVVANFDKAKQRAAERRALLEQSTQYERQLPPARPAGAQQRVAATPSNPVAGNIQGDSFTYAKSALFAGGGMLTISDGDDFIPDREVKIFLFPNPGESLANRNWKITPSSTGMKPHVHLTWQEDGHRKSQVMMSGYELELQIGEISDGTATGSLKLKAAGKVSVDLNGNFSAAVQ